ncbi:MAG: Fur family transcriptional regulator [Gammaproteobacteria bacterium]
MIRKNSLHLIKEDCVKRNLNLTLPREKVITYLLDASESRTAYQILEHLQQSDPGTKPPTVYRALDFLCMHGFTHRIESSNSFIACDLEGKKHMAQFFICQSCNQVTEFHSHKLSKLLEEEAANFEFSIQQEILEAKGICKSCRA